MHGGTLIAIAALTPAVASAGDVELRGAPSMRLVDAQRANLSFTTDERLHGPLRRRRCHPAREAAPEAQLSMSRRIGRCLRSRRGTPADGGLVRRGRLCRAYADRRRWRRRWTSGVVSSQHTVMRGYAQAHRIMASPPPPAVVGGEPAKRTTLRRRSYRALLVAAALGAVSWLALEYGLIEAAARVRCGSVRVQPVGQQDLRTVRVAIYKGSLSCRTARRVIRYTLEHRSSRSGLASPRGWRCARGAPSQRVTATGVSCTTRAAPVRVVEGLFARS